MQLLAGTDTGFAITPYGEWHAREMDLLATYAGLSPLKAICAMTKDAALTVNLEGQVGEVKPGQLADLIVVKGDPSKNIKTLLDKSNIKIVIKDGEIMKFDESALARRFPHKRVIAYSTGDLRYDDIYGDGVETGPPADTKADSLQEIDVELAHEIAAAGTRVKKEAIGDRI